MRLLHNAVVWHMHSNEDEIGKVNTAPISGDRASQDFVHNHVYSPAGFANIAALLNICGQSEQDLKREKYVKKNHHFSWVGPDYVQRKTRFTWQNIFLGS